MGRGQRSGCGGEVAKAEMMEEEEFGVWEGNEGEVKGGVFTKREDI